MDSSIKSTTLVDEFEIEMLTTVREVPYEIDAKIPETNCYCKIYINM